MADTTTSSTWTTDTWTTAPVAVSGLFLMDRIDSPVPYYVGKKTIDLWVDGQLISESVIKATCAKEFMDGTFGPYGEIAGMQIF